MKSTETKHSFIEGFFVVLGINISLLFICVLGIINISNATIAICLSIELLLFGITQYLYVVPIARAQHRKGELKVERGMYFASFIVLGINCFWLVIVSNFLDGIK